MILTLRGTQQGAMKKVVVNYLFTNTLNWILIFLHGRTKWWGNADRQNEPASQQNSVCLLT